MGEKLRQNFDRKSWKEELLGRLGIGRRIIL
jgi:hypothetical protein